MVLAGWVVILMGVELLSFKFLAAIALLLLALFPHLLVSLSFWLSIAGVFYIFLLLQYGKTYSKWLISLLLIPVGIFLLMLPIVHMIFPVTSVYQLLSPLLSIGFIPFYPFVMLLHLLGFGSLLDDVLLWLFTLPKESVEHLLPWWVTGSYVGLSIYAIFDKRAFYALLSVAVMYGMYIFTM
jgi:competence protein ComEC